MTNGKLEKRVEQLIEALHLETSHDVKYENVGKLIVDLSGEMTRLRKQRNDLKCCGNCKNLNVAWDTLIHTCPYGSPGKIYICPEWDIRPDITQQKREKQ